MYIQPNTTIKLYKNVPLDTSYEHTLWFNNVSEQNNYFHGSSNILILTLQKGTYQRVVKGSMRVGVSADTIYNCNYLAFQNTNYGTKWFYAFVTGVEYVNNSASEITFEVDVMQTYLFDTTLKDCFVEREHTSNDTIGTNINPEPVELGDYVCDSMDGTQKMAQYSIVLASTGIENLFPYKGGSYGGVFSGCSYKVYPNNQSGWAELSDLLDNITSQLFSDRIVGIFCMPTCFVTEQGGTAKTYDISKPKSVSKIGSYVPRNNKLLTYPYNFLSVNNAQGVEIDYRYEFFSSDDCKFILGGDMSMSCKSILAPYNYKGIPVNYEELISMDCAVQSSYNVTSFVGGVANNTLSTAMSIANTPKENKKGEKNANYDSSLSRNVIGGGANIVSDIIHSSNYHGSSTPSTLMALGIRDYMFLTKHITETFAQQIDDFFDKYGYATNRVKVPNRNVRAQWTYCKTNGCVLVGNAPADDVRRMCQIYDKGITFWKNPSNVGNYSLGNGIV